MFMNESYICRSHQTRGSREAISQLSPYDQKHVNQQVKGRHGEVREVKVSRTWYIYGHTHNIVDRHKVSKQFSLLFLTEALYVMQGLLFRFFVC